MELNTHEKLALIEETLSTNCELNSEIASTTDDYILPSTAADSLITDITQSMQHNPNKEQVSIGNLLATFLEQLVGAQNEDTGTANEPQSTYFYNLKKSFPEYNTDSRHNRLLSSLIDSGHHTSLQSDSAVESTSLSNSDSNSSSHDVDKRVVAMIEIERDISQIGQDYLDSFDNDSTDPASSIHDSSRRNSLKKYYDLEAVRRGCPTSASGRFVLNTGVNSLVDELMSEFDKLTTSHKI